MFILVESPRTTPCLTAYSKCIHARFLRIESYRRTLEEMVRNLRVVLTFGEATDGIHLLEGTIILPIDTDWTDGARSLPSGMEWRSYQEHEKDAGRRAHPDVPPPSRCFAHMRCAHSVIQSFAADLRAPSSSRVSCTGLEMSRMDSWQMLQLKMRSSGWRGFVGSVSAAMVIGDRDRTSWIGGTYCGKKNRFHEGGGA
jgi:hypothetical protein